MRLQTTTLHITLWYHTSFLLKVTHTATHMHMCGSCFQRCIIIICVSVRRKELSAVLSNTSSSSALVSFGPKGHRKIGSNGTAPQHGGTRFCSLSTPSLSVRTTFGLISDSRRTVQVALHLFSGPSFPQGICRPVVICLDLLGCVR